MGVMALFMGAGTASADSGPEVGVTTATESIDAVLQKVIPAESVAFHKLGDVVLRLEEFLEETEPR